MQPRILERDADLTRERRQQPQIVRIECADAAVARFAIGRGQHADRFVVSFDRQRNECDAAGEDAIRAFLETHRRALLQDFLRQFVIEKIAAHVAERAVDLEARAVAKEQRRAACIRQRDRPEENLVRELVDVQRCRDRETDVVKRLELPQPVLQLEVAFAHLLRHPLIRNHGAEECAGYAKRFEVFFGMIAAVRESHRAVAFARRSQRDENQSVRRRHIIRRIDVENLRRDPLRRFRRQTERCSIAQIHRAALKRSVSRECLKDCFAARRALFDLLDFVEEIAEPTAGGHGARGYYRARS